MSQAAQEEAPAGGPRRWLDWVRRGPYVLVPVFALLYFHWWILLRQIPFFQRLAGWYWPLSDKRAGFPWLLLLLGLILFAVVALMTRVRGWAWAKIAALALLYFALQFSLAFSEGRGFDGMRDRVARVGHSEFAELAVVYEDIGDVLVNYEELAASGRLGRYAQAKPPGQLLLYEWSQNFAELFGVPTEHEARLRRLHDFISISWPLLAALVLPLLFAYARIVLDEERALLACVLLLLIPSTELITLHADQVFYPSLFMGTLLLSALAARRRHPAWALAAGASLYLSLFFSFALVCVLPFVAVSVLWLVRDPASNRWDWRQGLRVMLGMLVAGLVIDGIFRLALRYDIWLRYQNAVAFHVAWRGWIWDWRFVRHFATLNLLEHTIWMGIPVAVFSLSSSLRGWGRAFMRRMDLCDALSVAMMLMILGLAFFGRSKAEVARLWLFLVPLICLMVSRELAARRWSWGSLLFYLFLLMQAGTVYLMKMFQDFV